MGRNSTPAIQRFWPRVNKTDSCWLWTGAEDGRGYGRIRVEGVYRKVHRFAYEALVGPIPEGLVIDHDCNNRMCVNPNHLKPMTDYQNVLRSPNYSANRTHCPHGHPYSATNTFERMGSRHCLTCRRARAVAPDLFNSLQTIVRGLREGWWGEGSGEMEEGELQQAEAAIAKALGVAGVGYTDAF